MPFADSLKPYNKQDFLGLYFYLIAFHKDIANIKLPSCFKLPTTAIGTVMTSKFSSMAIQLA